jgi:hypothetical protein
MTDLLKYISESVSNYLIFLFTSLFIYLLIVALINVLINKLTVMAVATIQIFKEKSDNKEIWKKFAARLDFNRILD